MCAAYRMIKSIFIPLTVLVFAACESHDALENQAQPLAYTALHFQYIANAQPFRFSDSISTNPQLASARIWDTDEYQHGIAIDVIAGNHTTAQWRITAEFEQPVVLPLTLKAHQADFPTELHLHYTDENGNNFHSAGHLRTIQDTLTQLKIHQIEHEILYGHFEGWLYPEDTTLTPIEVRNGQFAIPYHRP